MLIDKSGITGSVETGKMVEVDSPPIDPTTNETICTPSVPSVQLTEPSPDKKTSDLAKVVSPLSEPSLDISDASYVDAKSNLSSAANSTFESDLDFSEEHFVPGSAHLFDKVKGEGGDSTPLARQRSIAEDSRRVSSQVLKDLVQSVSKLDLDQGSENIEPCGTEEVNHSCVNDSTDSQPKQIEVKPGEIIVEEAEIVETNEESFTKDSLQFQTTILEKGLELLDELQTEIDQSKRDDSAIMTTQESKILDAKSEVEKPNVVETTPAAVKLEPAVVIVPPAAKIVESKPKTKVSPVETTTNKEVEDNAGSSRRGEAMASSNANNMTLKIEEDLEMLKTPPNSSRSGNSGTLVKQRPSVVGVKSTGPDSMHNNFVDAINDMDKFLGENEQSLFRSANEDDLYREIKTTFEQVSGSNNQLDAVAERLKLQFQAVILSKEREWASKNEKLEQQVLKIESERLALKKEAENAKRSVSEMSVVVTEYETTMTQMMAEMNNLQNKGGGEFGGDVEVVCRERDQAIEDLHNVENSFAELHKRYEKLRASIEDFKTNEDRLKEAVSDRDERFKKLEERYHKLREQAEHKLDKANSEIERLQKANEMDTLAIRSQLKRREAQVETLERHLEAKQNEVRELSSICDELLAKAGLGKEDS